ncbi:MAG: transposase [Candidatus Pacearchaeota archaeon]
MKRLRRTDEEKQQILEAYNREDADPNQIAEQFGFQSLNALYSLVSNIRKSKEQTPVEKKKRKTLSGRKKRNLTEEQLREIGDTAISKRFDVVRTTLVSGLGYTTFANNQAVEQIVEQLHEIDTKYSHLKFAPVVIPRNGKRIFSAEEDRLLEESLLEKIDNGYNGKGLPRGIAKEIETRLKTAGFIRSIGSIRGRIREIWSSRDGYVNGHLPSRVLHQTRIPATLEESLEQHLTDTDRRIEEEIEKIPEIKKVLKDVITPDYGAKKRMDNLRFAGKGHQQLLVYLLDPENYHRIFGPDFTLLCADFKLDENTSEEFYNKYKHLVEKLQMSDGDREAIHFIDNRLRLDLFFRKENGVYTVSEVKQLATNKINTDGTPGDQNADRAGQQLSIYKAAVEFNIQKLNRSLPENQRIPKDVLGYLVAYEIDEDLQSILQNRGDRVAVINKQNVLDYLGKPTKTED